MVIEELLLEVLWMLVTSVCWVVLVRRAGPCGFERMAGMFISCERVVEVGQVEREAVAWV